MFGTPKLVWFRTLKNSLAELQLNAFGDAEVLVNAQIPLLEARRAESVAAQVAERGVGRGVVKV